ncbi:ribonuclease H-like domain-containing protein [Tanacetum coccineum]
MIVCLFSLSVITVGASGSSNNTVLVNNLDAGNPLHIQTNDNSNIALIPFKLFGTENYRIWTSAMKLALQARKNLALLMGHVLKSLMLIVMFYLLNGIDAMQLF